MMVFFRDLIQFLIMLTLTFSLLVGPVTSPGLAILCLLATILELAEIGVEL